MPRKNAKKANGGENAGQEFFAAIAQIEKEKGIPAGYMMEKITQALASAYKRDHEGGRGQHRGQGQPRDRRGADVYPQGHCGGPWTIPPPRSPWRRPGAPSPTPSWGMWSASR